MSIYANCAVLIGCGGTQAFGRKRNQVSLAVVLSVGVNKLGIVQEADSQYELLPGVQSA